MKKFLTTIVVIIAITLVQQVSGQVSGQQNDSTTAAINLKEKELLNKIGDYVMELQKTLKRNPSASLSRENQIYILSLFTEVIHNAIKQLERNEQETITFGPGVEEQIRESVRDALEKKLAKEKKQ
ncbi:MAG: hypothetical protein WC606_03795 [Candidatus Absconditabacterales bacterium]|jgi:hypothetical protein